MRVRFLIVAIFAALMLLSAITPASAEDWPSVIRVGGVGQGYGLPYGTGLIAIAQVKGFIDAEFKDTPVKIEWTYFTGTGPAINEAFANGQLDFSQYGSTPGILARANGVPTRIVSGGGGANIYGVARVGLPINSVKDLKGHSVTFQKATILHWAFLKTLAASGIPAGDVTIVDLKTPDQLAALAAGQVDAAFGASQILPLRAQGIVNIFYSSKGSPQATGPNQFVVTESFEKQYPEATARFVRGYIKAAYWLSQEENRAEAIQLWSKSGVSTAIIQEDVADAALRDQFNPLLDDFFRWQYRDGIAFEKDQKLIRNDVDLATWIEPKYQDAALASLGLQNFWPKRSVEGVPIN
jgi:sulfonate transport system substrate-binding protein